ncbi:MAG TPA: DUF2007 domain-containing protein [Pyrinomonadaceae bacterium]
MITVASCYDIQEALRLQMVLGAADIPSFIPDEATALNAPYFFIGSVAGVRLQVAEEHLSEAQQIINTTREVRDDDKSNQNRDARSNQDEEEQRF